MSTVKLAPTGLHIATLACTLLFLSGCASNPYLEAKSSTAAGGQQTRDIAAARTQLTTAKVENVNLGDQKLQRERELERNDKRLRALEADLQKQEVALASALRARKISQARHAELKRESDSIGEETRAVDLKNKGDALGAADTKADAAKETRLRDLERRKKNLESTLAAIAKG